MGGSDRDEKGYDATMAEQLIDGTSPVSLVIPCRAEYVALCRLVAGAIGGRDGLDEEAVSDIKVLVTEACNCFLAMAAGGSPSDASACTTPRDQAEPAPADTAAPADLGSPECSLRMDFDSRPDAFEITVLYPQRHELIAWLEGCDSMSEAGLGLTILKALADRMAEVETDEGTALRLTKLLVA
jgi:hypothetical protein